MKMQFLCSYAALLFFCLMFNFNAVKVRDGQNIRPNLGDIVHHLQHPLYMKEYRPTEVQSLAKILPKPKNIYELTKAEILGDVKRSTDLDQKPTLYSTVVSSHPTSVIHSATPIGTRSIITDSAVASQFAETRKLPPGRFSVPTKLMELDYSNDNLKNLEKPIFLHTKSKVKSGNGAKAESESEAKAEAESGKPPLSGVKLGNKVIKASLTDVKKIKERLKNLKNLERTKRLNALMKAREDLVKDAKKIKQSLQKETNDLLSAKTASLSLASILRRYNKRLQANKAAQLKLTDRVEVKNELKDKLIKEIEGFRTRPSSYKELLKVDKKSIDNIVNEIKKRLNYP